MTTSAAAKSTSPTVITLAKPKTFRPAFIPVGATGLAVLAGVAIALAGRTVEFTEDTPIAVGALSAGADYVLAIDDADAVVVRPASSLDDTAADDVIGGFHVVPGGMAGAREGGSTVPEIHAGSIWDLAFRPRCPDPRGMAYVPGAPGAWAAAFWADIYLCAADHLQGTSRLGVTIADGRNLPQKLNGDGRFERFDFAAAQAVLAHHGKNVPSLYEFFALAYGVTEKTAAGTRSEVTALDAPRTSRFVIQATGQRYVWGHDGDPDAPRASLFGGDWVEGGFAGSRCANVVHWPDYSSGWVGARGRSDHLELA